MSTWWHLQWCVPYWLWKSGGSDLPQICSRTIFRCIICYCIVGHKSFSTLLKMKHWTISAVMIWLEVWHLHANYTFNACQHTVKKASSSSLPIMHSFSAIIKWKTSSTSLQIMPSMPVVVKWKTSSTWKQICSSCCYGVEDIFHMKTDMQLSVMEWKTSSTWKQICSSFCYGVEDIFHMKTDMQLFLLWSGRHLLHENRYASVTVME